MPKAYLVNDKYARRARERNFRARSVFKLEEIDNKFHIFKPGQVVLDLGAAPGSWLQYASEKIGSHGHALGIDLQPIAALGPNVSTFIADVYDENQIAEILNERKLEFVDLMLSDVAPKTTGIGLVDQKRSVEMSDVVFSLARKFLRRDTFLVMKVFRGKDFLPFVEKLKRHFKLVRQVPVHASRERSREIYLLCK